MSKLHDDDKAARAASHAQQAVRHTTDRAKKVQATTAASRVKRSTGGRPALNLGDEMDDDPEEESGADSLSNSIATDEAVGQRSEAPTAQMPLAEMVAAAQTRMPRRGVHASIRLDLALAHVSLADTAESFQLINPTRGVIALEDSVEFTRPGNEDWERVEAHEAIERASYSEAATRATSEKGNP
ncbi:hypothetical protein BKA62DRAFT_284354 [Auriculariales sp. MPI-PUGE-AT-0066]|nr:hypothetical protein BKA62DRAFT_284354 [Auriculariales sp. MPI-PUGE-AT-0066]